LGALAILVSDGFAFLFLKYHVGNLVLDGEFPTGRRAFQHASDDVDVHQDIVQRSKKVVVFRELISQH